MGRGSVRSYRLLALAGLVALVAAGCGSSNSSSSRSGAAAATSAAAATHGKANRGGKGAAPGGIIKRGMYAGITCSSSHCPEYSAFKSNAVLWCKGRGWTGHPVELPHVASPYHPLYVCFELVPANPNQQQANPNLVKNFYAEEQLILRQGHVQTDKFSTSENGQNIDGEWFGTALVKGKFGRADSPPAYYQAEWYARS